MWRGKLSCEKQLHGGREVLVARIKLPTGGGASADCADCSTEITVEAVEAFLEDVLSGAAECLGTLGQVRVGCSGWGLQVS